MHLSTIEMDRADAEAALAEWERELKSSRSDEDAAIAEGYRLLSKGKKLLRLSDTIRAGGQDDGYKPRLAVAPTQAQVVFLSRSRNGDVRYTLSDQPQPWGAWSRDVCTGGVQVADVLPELGADEGWAINSSAVYQRARDHHLNRACEWRAMVPVVPPRFRSRGWRGAHVLFEAEWARHTPPAPVDPALIRHVRGDLWVVLGVWDLTELERAVLLERNS